MGNRGGVCGGGAAQQCVDECTRVQLELEGRSRDPDEPECAPAGAVFNETLESLPARDAEALRFAGTSNLSAVRWLQQMGTSLHAHDRNNTTMLHAACRSGSCSIVQEMLKLSMSLDSADSAGWTPLHIAAMMGRCEVVMLLLRGRANAALTNGRGKTPLALCSDPQTKQVLIEFGGELGTARMNGLDRLDNLHANFMQMTGRGPHDESAPTCEPFFVPRVSLFHDDPQFHAEQVHLGMDLFRRSAGHGLAFIVASGVVHDHPTDLSAFLLRARADPASLGEFLGEDFSLAQTLRLAFIHSEDLAGTGVVGALLKAFRHIQAPLDLRKIDRLTSGIAHLWWRTHEVPLEGDEWDDIGDDENLDWSVYAMSLDMATSLSPDREEAAGTKLRHSIQSAEVLRRLMFSTVMLCWNLHAQDGAVPLAAKQQRLSLNGWLEINSGLEADGSNVALHVQKNIYQIVDEGRANSLLPPLPGAENGREEPPFQASAQLDAKLLQDLDKEVMVKGWASIPRGGLERQEATVTGLSGLGGRSTAHILSETSSPSVHQPFFDLPERQTESIYLTLRFALILFLATSPNETPFAFLRLKDAIVRDTCPENRSLVLAGRLKVQADDAVVNGEQFWKPFPDSSRSPLTLCFLLADGRFQPFEAIWLELHFKTDEDFQLWSAELASASEQPGCNRQKAPRWGLHARAPRNPSPPEVPAAREASAASAGEKDNDPTAKPRCPSFSGAEGDSQPFPAPNPSPRLAPAPARGASAGASAAENGTGGSGRIAVPIPLEHGEPEMPPMAASVAFAAPGGSAWGWKKFPARPAG